MVSLALNNEVLLLVYSLLFFNPSSYRNNHMLFFGTLTVVETILDPVLENMVFKAL
jgi:hypothetical protein